MQPRTPTPSLFTRVAAYCAPPLIGISLLLVLVATLYPYTVSLDRVRSLGTLGAVFANFLSRTSGYDDMSDNVLLFIPLGFGLASLAPMRRVRAWWLWAALICAGLSLTVETLQVFLPTRAPTALDVVTNTLGGAAGLLGFIVVGRLCATPRRFAIVAALAAGALLVFSGLLQRTARLTNWDRGFVAHLGDDLLDNNEHWAGTIRSLAISTTGVSAERLAQLTAGDLGAQDMRWLVRYDFTSPDPLADRAGRGWAVLPARPDALDVGPAGVRLSAQQSLTLPPEASAALNTAIQAAEELSLVITITPANASQWGWLFTINGDESDHLNLALAQDRRRLLIRLRTVATNEHAMPALVLHDLMAPDQPRTVGLSYRRGVLRVAVDGQALPDQLVINPALAFFSVMLPFKADNVLERYEWVPLLYTLLYSGLIFGPVGLALALWTRPAWGLAARCAAALGGSALAVSLYAALVVLAGGVWPSAGQMALQIGVALGAWALFWLMIAPVAGVGERS